MSNDISLILAVLGGVGVSFGIYSVVRGVKMNAVERARLDGKQQGSMQTTLDSISSSLSEVKKDVKNLINTSIKKEELEEVKKDLKCLEIRVKKLEK